MIKLIIDAVIGAKENGFVVCKDAEYLLKLLELLKLGRDSSMILPTVEKWLLRASAISTSPFSVIPFTIRDFIHCFFLLVFRERIELIVCQVFFYIIF